MVQYAALVCGYCVAIQGRNLEKDGVVWNGAVSYARFCGYSVAMQSVVLEKDGVVWNGAVCYARL